MKGFESNELPKQEKVPLVGLEPTRPFTGPWILNPMRLPFRHSGLQAREYILAMANWVVAAFGSLTLKTSPIPSSRINFGNGWVPSI